jgi:hypothetical protein
MTKSLSFPEPKDGSKDGSKDGLIDIPKLDLISHGKTETSTSKLFSIMLGGKDKVQKDDLNKEITN